MLHLLLDEQKKEIRAEYHLRFATIAVILIAIALGLWTLSLVPSFVRVQIERAALKPQQDFLDQARFLENGASLEEYVATVNEKIDLLEQPEYPVSQLVREITERQVRSIDLNVIEFTAQRGEAGQILLGGLANNRESLVEFNNALETSEYFESIDVPFSNFARSTDIPFTMTITLKPPVPYE